MQQSVSIHIHISFGWGKSTLFAKENKSYYDVCQNEINVVLPFTHINMIFCQTKLSNNIIISDKSGNHSQSCENNKNVMNLA